MQDKPQDYWEKIADKKFQKVPYTPNPMKYTYLLQNQYEEISNLHKRNVSSAGTGGEPKSAGLRSSVLEESKAKAEDASPDGTKYYKLGDPIAPPPVPGSRAPATGTEMGMFGAGAGKFEDESNKKNNKGKQANVNFIPSSPGLNRKKREVLGDFTMFRLNKEFENF